MSRDENCLLSELVDNYQNSIKPREWQKFLNKIHGNGILEIFGDRKLLERSIELLILGFGSHVNDIGFVELLYITFVQRLG